MAAAMTFLKYGLIVQSKDILEPLGFIRHLYACMNIAPGGLAFFGVVCSSWIAINRIWAAHCAEGCRAISCQTSVSGY
jgi:hypothetical protein